MRFWSRSNGTDDIPASPLNTREEGRPTVQRSGGQGWPGPLAFLQGAAGLGGFTNSQTGAGTSQDNSTWGYFTPTVGLTRYRLETIYGQSWAAKKFIDIPVDDAFVRWRTFDDQVEEMDEAEDKHQVQERLRRAFKAGRLMGSCLLLILTGEAPLETELNPERINEGDLKNLLPVDRYYLEIVNTNQDIFDPNYGQPTMYRVNLPGISEFDIHASRTIRFDGIRSPTVDWEIYDYGWGISELVPVMVSVCQDASIAGSMAHLSEEASVSVMKVRGFRELLAGYKDPERASPYEVMTQNLQMKSNYRTMMIDSEDEFERVAVSFGGIPDLLDRYATRLSAAADIPATRFLGRSPSGLNATGESDMINYAMRIQALQRRMLDGPLMLLDQVLARDKGLKESPSYQWNSLVDLGKKQEAQVLEQKARAIALMLTNGVIDEDEARTMLSGDEIIGDLEERPDFMEEADAQAEEDRALEMEMKKAALTQAKTGAVGSPASTNGRASVSSQQSRH